MTLIIWMDLVVGASRVADLKAWHFTNIATPIPVNAAIHPSFLSETPLYLNEA